MEKPVQRPAVKESQQTTPTGLEIPVPKHSEVMDVLKKVAPPVKRKARPAA